MTVKPTVEAIHQDGWSQAGLSLRDKKCHENKLITSTYTKHRGLMELVIVPTATNDPYLRSRTTESRRQNITMVTLISDARNGFV